MHENSGLNEEWMQDLQNGDPDIRRRGAERFISEEMPDTILPLLVQLLKDPDKGVRDAASLALTYNEHTRIPELVVPLISDDEIYVRNIAGDILLRRGITVVPALIAYLPERNDDDQKFIIDILGLIGSPEPMDDIIMVLKATENENVSLACIEALGNLRVAEALPHLKDVFFRTELFGPTIIEAMGKIGSEDAAQFITDNYKNSDDLTKFSMLEAMGELGDEKTFYFLLNELSNSDIPYTWAIVRSLCNLRDKFGLDVPYEETIKQKILDTLVEGDKESLKLMFEFLDDAEITLRPVLELLKNFVYEMDGAYIKQIRDLELLNFCDKLTGQLNNPDEEVRKLVMELLFMLKPDMAIVFSDKMSGDPNFWNRMRFVELVEQYMPASKEELLTPMLTDLEAMVKERVEWALDIRNNG
ncbi:MAG: HEAT repeat domain-containing protein [Ignavibacteriales bacterium]|nr:HEAT repeat domain-containing protein [Ignavibacteriales bacterium]